MKSRGRLRKNRQWILTGNGFSALRYSVITDAVNAVSAITKITIRIIREPLGKTLPRLKALFQHASERPGSSIVAQLKRRA